MPLRQRMARATSTLTIVATYAMLAHATRRTKETGRAPLAAEHGPQHQPCTAQSTRAARPTQMTVTYLDLARAARDKAARQLEAIAREPSPVIVLDVYYANPYDASIQRGRIVDRCMNTIERLDATIARLSVEPDAVADDIDIDDAIVGVPDYEFWFGRDDIVTADVLAAKQQEADDLTREVS